VVRLPVAQLLVVAVVKAVPELHLPVAQLQVAVADRAALEFPPFPELPVLRRRPRVVRAADRAALLQL